MATQNQKFPDNPQIQVIKSGKTGLFTNYIFKAIPLAFDESLSYYECLCGLLNYLKNVIIPTVNNNANAVAELQNLYNELHDYVKNYFDNLDVQEEINNKLDAMVEDGTLETILSEYIDKRITRIYNTVEDMKNAELNENTYINTLGYYAINDGGGSLYYITNNKPNTYYELLNNGKYAELIKKDLIDAKQIGCKTDGTDNSSIINNYLSTYKDGLHFSSGNYAISNEIDTFGNIIMENDAYFDALNEMDCCVHINKNVSGDFVNNFPRNQILKINVNCNKKALTGIRTDNLHWANLTLTVINAVTYGAYINYSSTPHAENNFIINISNDTDYVNNNTTGIYVHGSDDIFENITTINCKTGVVLRGGDNSIYALHSWLNIPCLWTGSICLKIMASKNHITNLICDTIETGIYLDYDGNFPFGLFIDFFYSLINDSIVNTDTGKSFKIFDMSRISNDSKNNSNLIITNYTGQDENTSKINLGGNGICPYNTVLGYNNDYQLPIWPYSLDYAPQGQFYFQGNTNVTGKPSEMKTGNYSIITKNTPYGKSQELVNNQNDINTGDTVYNEDNIPLSGFVGFYKRTFNKYGIGNNCWGIFASYHVSEPSSSV